MPAGRRKARHHLNPQHCLSLSFLQADEKKLEHLLSEPRFGRIRARILPPTDGRRSEFRFQSAKAQTGRVVVVFLLLFLLSWLFQYYGHSWNGENNSESDAPAHYVSWLMVHDYIRLGFPVSPVKFAEVFYAHYPKVAIGHWPPMFYLLQAAWMSLFGDSLHSDLTLMAFVTALLAMTLYVVARREFESEAAAIFCAVLMLSIPIVQWCEDSIMADTPVALFSFWAALCWARYLDSGRIRWAAGFSSLALLGILTKGNGYAVVLAPPITILLTRRFDLLKNIRLWLAGAPIALSLLWVFFTWRLVGPTMQFQLGVAFFMKALLAYTAYLSTAAGVHVFLFALIGATTLIPEPRTPTLGGFWLAILALSIAEILFHSITPAGIEPRFVVVMIPCILVFMWRGVVQTTAWLSFVPLPFSGRIPALAALIAILFAYGVFALPAKQPTGFAQAAAFLTNHRKFTRPAVLVSSEGDGEGPFIARMAELDHVRLDHVVLRASHVLADSDWNGRNYKLLVHSAAEIADYLSQVPIGAVVIDRTSRKLPNLHQALLEQAIASHPEQWKLAGVFPADAIEHQGISVYWRNRDAIPQRPILLNVAGTLRRTIMIDLSRPPW